MAYINPCDCACHLNPYSPCSVPGGCGSVGCGRSRATGCVTCPVYRPDAEPRLPHYPPVCDSDRAILDHHHVEIANLLAVVLNPDPPSVDTRRYAAYDRKGDLIGERRADPLSAIGGVGPVNGRTAQPSVSGSRDRPLPIRVDEVDLTGPSRIGALAVKRKYDPSLNTDWSAIPGGDPLQVGHLSVATILDFWVQDIRAGLFPDHHLPPATVDEMVSWLRNRLDIVCDTHPEIEVYAADLRKLRNALRHITGETESQPQPCQGVACGRCDLRMLFRQQDGSGDVDCHNPDCRAVYRPDDYREMVKSQARNPQPTMAAE